MYNDKDIDAHTLLTFTNGIVDKALTAEQLAKLALEVWSKDKITSLRLPERLQLAKSISQLEKNSCEVL